MAEPSFAPITTPLASDRIEHRTHVVHPLLRRGSRSSEIGSERPIQYLSNEISRLNEASRRT